MPVGVSGVQAGILNFSPCQRYVRSSTFRHNHDSGRESFPKSVRALGALSSMRTLLITAPILLIVWHAVPLVFCIAFFLWWRRLKHWSFAISSLATGLGVAGHLCTFLAHNIPRFGKTEEQV